MLPLCVLQYFAFVLCRSSQAEEDRTDERSGGGWIRSGPVRDSPVPVAQAQPNVPLAADLPEHPGGHRARGGERRPRSRSA